MKVPRDFFARNPLEQSTLLEETWCASCQEADLGMEDPQEYEEAGLVFVIGRCVKCGGVVQSELRST